mmetsp:Transcript_100155/g.279792  ORF Transcript_100155/g.279792 Transcript_100155/m.279792 type:complete len:99 (+) Transcript_100155:2-298(+)
MQLCITSKTLEVLYGTPSANMELTTCRSDLCRQHSCPDRSPESAELPWQPSGFAGGARSAVGAAGLAGRRPSETTLSNAGFVATCFLELVIGPVALAL